MRGPRMGSSGVYHHGDGNLSPKERTVLRLRGRGGEQRERGVPVTGKRMLYSRFQVLSQGEPAWVDGPWRERYYFDGLRFWKLRDEHPARPQVSWQTPAFGWTHAEHCRCSLCAGIVVPARLPVGLGPEG